MPLHRLKVLASFVAVGMISSAPTFSAGRETMTDEHATLLKQMSETWRSQLTEVSTAKIKYDFFCSGGKFILKAEDAIQLLDSADVGKPEQFKQLVESLLGRKLTRLSEVVAESAIVIEGKKTRVDDPHGTRAIDGTSDVFTSTSNRSARIDVAGKSKYARTTFVDFRLTPKASAAESLNIVSDSGKSVTLAGQSHHCEVDKATGIVTKLVWRFPNGQVRRERLQSGIARFSGDVFLPTAVIDAGFQDNMLYSVQIIVVKDAQFNVSLPEDAFAVSLPAGYDVFDYRNDPHHGSHTKLQSETRDVAAQHRVQPPR